MTTDDLVAIPCERGAIVREFVCGDLAVKMNIDAEDTELFFKAFVDSNEAVFLSNGDGAIEATRGPIMGERKDGSISVRVVIAAKDKQRFREIWPKPGGIAVLALQDPETGRRRIVDDMAASVEPARYGSYARVLRTHIAFMLNRAVWEKVGSDEEYLEWCRHQKCAKCKWTPHWEMSDFIGCEAAHVRRITDGAGVALKPAYSAVPLCHKCHSKQHEVGESFLGAKEAVDKMRIQHVQSWVWETLKRLLGFEHWSEVPPELLLSWTDSHDITECLPDCYRESD